MVTRRGILVEAGLVGLIDDNKPKVFEGRKKSGTWANYDKRCGLIGFVNTLPNKVTFGFGKLGMKRNYLSAKMFLKTTD